MIIIIIMKIIIIIMIIINGYNVRSIIWHIKMLDRLWMSFCRCVYCILHGKPKCGAAIYKTVIFLHLINRLIYLLVDPHLLILAYESTHYDFIKWKQFPRYWPFVRGIHRSPVNSPYKGPNGPAVHFLKKYREFPVKCEMSSRNCSKHAFLITNHYMNFNSKPVYDRVDWL